MLLFTCSAVLNTFWEQGCLDKVLAIKDDTIYKWINQKELQDELQGEINASLIQCQLDSFPNIIKFNFDPSKVRALPLGIAGRA